VKSARRG